MGWHNEAMSRDRDGFVGRRIWRQEQVHDQVDEKWWRHKRDYKKNLKIINCRNKARSEYRILDFRLPEGVSGEAFLVLSAASGAQPKPQLGRKQWRRLRLGHLRPQRYFHLHQNFLRKATSLPLRGKLIFSIFVFYKIEKTGAREGNFFGRLAGRVHASVEYLSRCV